MPLLNDFFEPNSCKLALWKIEESVAVLAQGLALNPTQIQALEQRKTFQAKQGFLAARQALCSLNVPLDSLHISPKGAPQLPNQYCSLSHTQDFAAAVLGPKKIGVDIEAHREKIQRIAPKFIHQTEMRFLQPLDALPALTRIWTAKEAIYKALQQPGVSFAQQILLHPFSLQDHTGTAEVHLSGETLVFQLQFATFKQHELTIAQPE